MTRTLVIGDIHGCADELDLLLREVGHDKSDKVVCVGDVVGKGPDSRGVLARLREMVGQSVLGNHDAACLKWREDPKNASPQREALCRSFDEDDWRYLDSMPLWVEIDLEKRDETRTIVVHAGRVPGVPLEKQDRRDFLTMRSIREDGSASKFLEEGVPWASVWKGPEHVVFGHDAIRKLQRYSHATGLDTGCVYGGELSALVLPENKIVSVKAKKVWAPFEGK